MATSALMGGRIRARRVDLGLKQAELARRVGISAPYLNLIEHDRRRIGGRLMVALARALGLDPAVLAEGPEIEQLAALSSAAAAQATESGRASDLAARFPEWAGLVLRQHRRIQDLEATVETLADRLAHDPRLAASMHEVLSTVTAIRATAAILSEERDLDRDWLARFHRNLDEDSRRLADSARALVAYLDGEGGGAAAAAAATPQEAVEAWLDRRGWHLPEVEAGGEPSDLPEGAEARELALGLARTWAGDARLMPRGAAEAAAAADDPAALAREFGVPLSAAFRRLAALPGPGFGLVVADAGGGVLFRRPVAGFQMPRLGAACPLWPLWRALARPLQPIRAVIEQATRLPARFVVWAVAEPSLPPGFGGPEAFRASMLIRPATPADPGEGEPVGTSCRVCPRPSCPARREPSVLPG